MPIIDNTDKSWECWGKRDPYYGVLACENYHHSQLTNAGRKSFFSSGEQQIEEVFTIIQTHIAENFRPQRALDFGCGVGRLLIPLAQHSDRVIGMDVSPSMLKEAEQNCLQRGIYNVDFLRSDNMLSTLNGEIDFVLAYLVFQHIPRKRGEKLVTRLIDHLALGGVGVMHFVYARRDRLKKQCIQWGRKYLPGFNAIVNLYLNQPWDQPMMQMNLYDIGRLFQIMHPRGCSMFYAQLLNHPKTKSQAIQLFFRKDTFRDNKGGLIGWHPAGRFNDLPDLSDKN